jgi:hypothetical protein
VYYPASSGLSSLFLSSFVAAMATNFGFLNSTHTCVIFKQAYLSVFINTVLPLWGKRIKFKKTKVIKLTY